MIFHKTLIHCYLQYKRDLPWRKTTNPYYVWLSEIMLQQTRVAQGLPYYLKFIEAFPTVHDLANANESFVLKLWQGLGYYSRARNLHYTAKYISKDLKGIFPDNFSDLKKLKGVGDYTASAIASICFNESTAVVDGNVYRVLSRYFGIATPINTTKGIKEFKALAQSLIDDKQPGMYNQAIMDFGATLCKPQNPLCNECPFAQSCLALANNTISSLPVKEKKTKVKKRYFNYLVLKSPNNTTILQERTSKGIWQGLYQFPLIETLKEVKDSKVIEDHSVFKSLFNKEASLVLYNIEPVVHKLSHQHLYTNFWIVNTENTSGQEVVVSDLEKYPVPVLIANFLNQFFN